MKYNQVQLNFLNNSTILTVHEELRFWACSITDPPPPKLHMKVHMKTNWEETINSAMSATNNIQSSVSLIPMKDSSSPLILSTATFTTSSGCNTKATYIYLVYRLKMFSVCLFGNSMQYKQQTYTTSLVPLKFSLTWTVQVYTSEMTINKMIALVLKY